MGFQTWILKEAGADALPASAIYVAIFNGVIGLGAVLGAFVLSLAGLAQIFSGCRRRNSLGYDRHRAAVGTGCGSRICKVI